MKIVFIGCVQFSHATLEHLLTLKEADVVGVITKRESPSNDDFRSLEPVAQRAGISCFLTTGNDQVAMIDWLKNLKPDIVYCFGWSLLLTRNILSIPRLGVVGYHPAALPKNRGRHPIIWTLALGLRKTASTFFFMDEGADSGDILSQRHLTLDQTDDASTLYQRLTAIAVEQITEFTAQLASNTYSRIKQDHTKANYWRKRTKYDGQIDWRMSARCIHNLVRALTRPYPGAHCRFKAEEIKIWKTQIIEPPLIELDNIEPGKILDTNGSHIVVKCGEGALKLLDHEFRHIPERGAYL